VFLRENNIQPFSWKDVGSFSAILSDCKTQIERVLGKVLDSKVKSAEVNITQEVSGNATQSGVLNLLNHACLTSKRDNVKYVSTCMSCRYKEVANTIIFREPQ
jgi:hypothetical protein